MNKNVVGVLGLVLGVLVCGPIAAKADVMSPTEARFDHEVWEDSASHCQGKVDPPSNTICKMDGRDPFPFVHVNQKVELSAGEVYELQGKIILDLGGVAFFQVDLCSHPWLANAARRRLPIYPVLNFAGHESEYPTGRTIRLLARAGYVFVPNRDTGIEYVITLTPIASMDVSSQFPRASQDRD